MAGRSPQAQPRAARPRIRDDGRAREAAVRERVFHARGIQRRARLLDAAWQLLGTRDLDTLSLGDVARAARVPVASAYHFYANIRALYDALAERVASQLLERHRAPLRRRPRAWREVIDELIDRGVGYFAGNVAACRLLIGPHTPPELKFRDRQRDRLLARVFEEQLESEFCLPQLPDRPAIFFRALEIADLILCLSMVEHGAITPAMKAEAKRACVAYLGSYLPERLPRRRARGAPLLPRR